MPGLLFPEMTEIPPAKQATEVPSAPDLSCVPYSVRGNGAGFKNFSSQIHLRFVTVNSSPLPETWAVIGACKWRGGLSWP